MVTQQRILIIDDIPLNIQRLGDILGFGGYGLRCALSCEAALKALETEVPDLLLLNYRMPSIHGFDVDALFDANQAFARVPIIYIAETDGSDSEADAGLAAGNVEYIGKPFQPRVILAQVMNRLAIDRPLQPVAIG